MSGLHKSCQKKEPTERQIYRMALEEMSEGGNSGPGFETNVENCCPLGAKCIELLLRSSQQADTNYPRLRGECKELLPTRFKALGTPTVNCLGKEKEGRSFFVCY